MLSALASAIEQMDQLGDSSKDRQSKISVNEVWHLWELLSARYDVQYETLVLQHLATDRDFKDILAKGLDTLREQIKHKEKLLQDYGIPLPEKPPEAITSTVRMEEVTDKYIYRRIFRGIQDFLNIHLSAVTQSTSAHLRRIFIDLLFNEVKIYDSFVEYGKLKGWVENPPRYGH